MGGLLYRNQVYSIHATYLNTMTTVKSLELMRGVKMVTLNFYDSIVEKGYHPKLTFVCVGF